MVRRLVRRTPLQEAVLCASLGVAGLLLAMLVIWLGVGVLDGFLGREQSHVQARLLRYLPLTVILSAFGGVMLYSYFEAALAKRARTGVVLVGVVRAFALFPFLGFGLLFAFMAGMVEAPLRWAGHRLRGRRATGDDARASVAGRLLVAMLWVLVLPFSLLGIESEGDVEIPLDSVPWGVHAVLPLVMVLMLLAPGFESEATGERVDVLWLLGFATLCIADGAVVLGMVVPRLDLRERAREVAARRAG